MPKILVLLYSKPVKGKSYWSRGKVRLTKKPKVKKL